MAQSAVYREAEGEKIDYTPGTAVTGGSVVVAPSFPCLAEDDIAASRLGAVDPNGIWKVPKATGAVALWGQVWWNPTGTPVTGDASSGAASTTKTAYPLGIAVLAAASGDSYVYVKANQNRPAIQQQTPTAETSTTQTYLAAEILTGIITSTQTGAVTGTLDTGANMDLAFPNAQAGDAIDWVLINLGSSSGAVTVTASTGHTIVGNAVVAITTSAIFRSRKTAADTWVTYRIAG